MQFSLLDKVDVCVASRMHDDLARHWGDFIAQSTSYDRTQEARFLDTARGASYYHLSFAYDHSFVPSGSPEWATCSDSEMIRSLY